ncbi:hypothetical protein K435DRAFT_749662 [Dendrothele bispora CBS 962.96]|uniref:THIF-type NAD/FAD binding fold domain-containing protein n=1 Tax=Dendrothele bispora (strain CBS 962.96) TaxID=1314807 RepID=A0A4S8MHM2_DENBC|nr:hypothetical protein K435DRAFT_749662 [Dendrothele bispora CBS 962.96]
MNNLHSHQTQLILTALAASAATAAVISAYTSYSRTTRRQELNEDVLRSIHAKGSNFNFQNRLDKDQNASEDIELPSLKDTHDYDESLIREQLARNYAFFGEEGMTKVRKGSVVVVGCGGVGSWAAVMLVRSGISKIRLVDFDQVTLSSLNRHATASLEDVGTSKVKCVEKALKSISRWVQIDACVDLWQKDQGGALLEGADWVIDAIDNIQTKVDLLKYCHDNGIKVFSSMGAGAKTDPTRIQIADISSTIYDPLARSVRRRLRLLGVSSGIPVVYSTEVPSDIKLLPLAQGEFEKGKVNELGAFDDFRVRILPVLGPLPAIFGLNAATWVVSELAGRPIANPLAVKGRRKLYERMWKDLVNREQKIVGGNTTRIPLDEDDVGFIFEDLYRGRSVIPPHPIPTKPVLVRWNLTKPLTLENCVVMEDKEALKHIKACKPEEGVLIAPEEVWGNEVEEVVSRKSEEVKKYLEWIETRIHE